MVAGADGVTLPIGRVASEGEAEDGQAGDAVAGRAVLVGRLLGGVAVLSRGPGVRGLEQVTGGVRGWSRPGVCASRGHA